MSFRMSWLKYAKLCRFVVLLSKYWFENHLKRKKNYSKLFLSINTESKFTGIYQSTFFRNAVMALDSGVCMTCTF